MSGFRHPPVPWRSLRPQAVLGLTFLCLLMSFQLKSGETAATQPSPSFVRFGMSSSLFREVNENDARASVRAYAKQLAEGHGLMADPNPRIFTGVAELSTLLSFGEVDLISLPTQEYLALEETLVTGPLLVSIINGSDYEEYVLLVGADSHVKGLADLNGLRLVVLDSLQGSLASPWLEVLLRNQASAPPEAFFSRVTRAVKITQTVLPVFFHQADACVVTRKGFALMGELNPQIIKQLRVLETSPPLVPHLTCFRAGFDPALKA